MNKDIFRDKLTFILYRGELLMASGEIPSEIPTGETNDETRNCIRGYFDGRAIVVYAKDYNLTDVEFNEFKKHLGSIIGDDKMSRKCKIYTDLVVGEVGTLWRARRLLGRCWDFTDSSGNVSDYPTTSTAQEVSKPEIFSYYVTYTGSPYGKMTFGAFQYEVNREIKNINDIMALSKYISANYIPDKSICIVLTYALLEPVDIESK